MESWLPFLGSFPIEAREWLAPRFVVKNHRPGATLFEAGEKPTGLYQLVEGHVMIVVTNAVGRRFALDVCGPGDQIGVTHLLKRVPYHSACDTLTGVSVAFLPAEDFFRAREQPWFEFHRWYERGLLDQIAHLAEQCTHMALAKSAKPRLMYLLLRLGGYSGNGATLAGPCRVPITLTQDAMARAIGASRHTVYRHIAELLQAGVIRWRGRAISVEHPAKLRKMLNGETNNC